jgi:addiction module HigA family antidote
LERAPEGVSEGEAASEEGGMKRKRRPNRKPTHPGAILREDVLPALKMTQGEFSKRLRVSRLTVSDLLHEKRALSAEMAVRLARLLSTSPESWLRMQEAVDLWTLAHDPKRVSGIRPIERRAAD